MTQILTQLGYLQFIPGTLHAKHSKILSQRLHQPEYESLLNDLYENRPYVFKSLLLLPTITTSIYKLQSRGSLHIKNRFTQLIFSSFDQFYNAESYQFLIQYIPFQSNKQCQYFKLTLDQRLSQDSIPDKDQVLSELVSHLGPTIKLFDPLKDPIFKLHIDKIFSTSKQSDVPAFFSKLKPNPENSSLLSVAQLMQVESQMELLMTNETSRWLFFTYLIFLFM